MLFLKNEEKKKKGGEEKRPLLASQVFFKAVYGLTEQIK